MELLQALENISWYSPKFAEEEILCIREHKEEAIPMLLESLRRSIEFYKTTGPDEWEDDGDDGYSCFYTIFLLGELKARDAVPMFLEILTLDEDTLDIMLGDVLTEGIGRAIGTMAAAEDFADICSIITNRDLHMYSRTAAITALEVMYVKGILQYSNLIDVYGALIDMADDNQLEFMGSLAVSCHYAKAVELYPKINRLYENNLIDRMFVAQKEFADTTPVPEEEIKKNLIKYGHREITDTIKELNGWAAFEPEDKVTNHPKREEISPRVFHSSKNPITKPPKVGRNTPCPCGSGKKYKQCCINSD